jgi:cyclopropane-fatty-acyl-phospholipid synthase
MRAAAFGKNAGLCTWLEASEDSKILDVGCGWGSLALYLAWKKHARVTGLTLSPHQAQYAAEQARQYGVADHVDTMVLPFLDYSLSEESFDGVSFIGSIVHMEERGEIMQRVARALRPGGRLVISETYVPNYAGDGMDTRASHFILRDIFGYSHATTLSDELRAIEDAGLRLLHVENSTQDYIQTLEEWLKRLRGARDTVEKVQPGAYRDLRRYLELGRASFRYGTMLQYEIVAERPTQVRRNNTLG